MRLRSDIWVSAYLRRCMGEGAYATLRRRGAREAGAIFVKIDMLDGLCRLFAPAPQSEVVDRGVERQWMQIPGADSIANEEAESRLQREAGYDPDIWIIEVEDKLGRDFLDVVG